MKKLLIVVMIALLAVALVACGGNDTTTKKPEGTTGGTVTTTGGTTTTTEPTDDTEEPDDPVVTGTILYDEGVDILFGDLANAAINPFWSEGMYPCAFEDFHKALDYNWALVFTMNETENMIYETLVFTDPDAPTDAPNSQTGMINTDYQWFVYIDDVEYEIKRFQFLNDITKGYFRCDLGEEFEPKVDPEDPEAPVSYDIKLKIVEKATNKVAFWAYMTDPELLQPYEFVKPDPIEMVDDPNRDPSHVALGSKENPALKGLSGAAGFNADETYENLFDNDVRSKLCTNDVTTAIEFQIIDLNSAVNVVSYSLVGANDDAQYTTRLVSNFKLYSSSTGAADSWVLIDEVNLGEEIGEVINYGERNYKLDATCTHHYYRLEITHATDMYQISDIILYAEAE